MAKRSQRKNRTTRPRRTTAVVENSSKAVDLGEEYQYVIEDLKRIGIIAAILIGGLVALSFFL